ncbi:long-chain fatty acid transporter [Psychromonas marina]|uniref:Long-chain fatty acid transporter n=1 Tax=Psychromonas marina TaxID=88364 RepID=A0ABQ6E2G3_9GAMM|nr:outer membrane protein transport protein [Psychromonas marina]GLS91171.1 long-chain fatty acid transporter [Psychromonas marina]
MFNKITTPVSVSLLILTSASYAGGLSLSQIGTTQSTATAGVSNVTNNRDASAVVANAAGLSGIEDSSFMFGLQYLDINSDFEGDNRGATNSSEGLVIPHISYAKRFNEQWVGGVALHSPGGLGLEYDNGIAGLGRIESSTITTLNISASASYQVNDRFALGGSVIAQYGGLQTQLARGQEVDIDDWSPSFSLSSLYQINESTHIGAVYNYGVQYDLDTSVGNKELSREINWPQSVELGVQHQISNNLNVMVNANWQQWSQFAKGYDDTYGAGIAFSYQLNSWRLHSGFSADSSPLSAENRGHALPLDAQWRLGLGAEKKLENEMTLGLAYQYQSLGDGEITDMGLLNGKYNNNRIHFITASLSF